MGGWMDGKSKTVHHSDRLEAMKTITWAPPQWVPLKDAHSLSNALVNQTEVSINKTLLITLKVLCNITSWSIYEEP